MSDRNAMDQIHGLLDGREWGADTLDEIATVVRGTGRVIREPMEEQCCPDCYHPLEDHAAQTNAQSTQGCGGLGCQCRRWASGVLAVGGGRDQCYELYAEDEKRGGPVEGVSFGQEWRLEGTYTSLSALLDDVDPEVTIRRWEVERGFEKAAVPRYLALAGGAVLMIRRVR